MVRGELGIAMVATRELQLLTGRTSIVKELLVCNPPLICMAMSQETRAKLGSGLVSESGFGGPLAAKAGAALRQSASKTDFIFPPD